MAERSGYYVDRFYSQGNKKLRLKISPETNDAYTYINNILGEEPVRGSTTALYMQVREAIQQTANITRKDIIYTLTTQNSSMKQWTLTTGNEIFAWNEIEDQAGTLFATRIFYPAD